MVSTYAVIPAENINYAVYQHCVSFPQCCTMGG